jgi:hypothetical protein
MRFHELVFISDTDLQVRLSTATLYVLPHQWDRLEILRRSCGLTKMTAKRPLAPRYPGHSIDILCSSAEVAWKLLGDWVMDT